MNSILERTRFSAVVLAVALAASACSGRRVNQEGIEAEAPAVGPAAPIATTTPELTDPEKLQARVRELEAEVSRLQSGEARSESVRPGPTSGVGLAPEAELAGSDPQRGYAVDSATRLYQRALILHRAGQHGEAIAAFNQFVEDHPDHALAGSAVYYIGGSYLRQKEFQLAANTFQRGITSYDRNPRIAQTLQGLAEAQDALQQPAEAARSRSMLANLFQGSPAVRSMPPREEAPPAAAAPGLNESPAEDSKALDGPPEGSHPGNSP